MSFSFSSTGCGPIETINKAFGDPYVPAPVREYIWQGISALQKRYEGEDIKVDVSAYGHLHNSELGNSEVTTATVSVSLHVEKQDKQD